MLRHRNTSPSKPARVLLLGARGFIGRWLQRGLEARGIALRALSRLELDLATPDAAERLLRELEPDDALVMLAALTPGRATERDALRANLAMGEALCRALAASPCAHVVYFSSDAVYPFQAKPISESSCAAPGDLYGAMHRARELMLRHAFGGPLAILRPTLVYGPEDTHNAYGPNRFRRSAARSGCIELFGNGEEQRDHVLVDDLVALTAELLLWRSEGVLNAASGASVSYLELARLVQAGSSRPVEIVSRPRERPIVHRQFDVAARRAAFPELAFASLEEGLRRVHRSDPA